MNMEKSLASRYSHVAAVVSLYWSVSITMVFVNKAVLGESAKDNKDAPLFVTFFQCLITVLAIVIVSKLSKIMPKVFTASDVHFDIESAKEILPLSIVFVAMITFNNLCLKYVGVAFYYVGRSLSTVFNVICSYIMLGQLTSKKAMMCCAIIIFGFLLGVDQESGAESFSMSGIFFGVSASLCVALNSIYTKKVLPVVDGSIWQLSFYNNVLACMLFIPLIIVFGEVPKIYSLIVERDSIFWFLMVVSGLFGFAIGYVTGLQIKVTSPLTHMVSGTAKACAQTVIATWWYGDSKSWLWWISNWVVLKGSMGYSYVKAMEMKQMSKLPVSMKS